MSKYTITIAYNNDINKEAKIMLCVVNNEIKRKDNITPEDKIIFKNMLKEALMQLE